ncbi:5'-3' exonuclease PLD3 [Drosophila tropicalis]|uniref:5'-3' exonuclease PLD3 n=1 Tax=Drosophila tropicalis TaxID=46794 RepID=UPI0035AB69A0
MSQRQGEIPIDYQPVSRTAEDHGHSSCCRRPNCLIKAREMEEGHGLCCCTHGYMIPIFILFVLVVIILLLPWDTFHRREEQANHAVVTPLPCQLQLVESLPMGLNFSDDSPSFLNTFQAFQWLINSAKISLDIAAPHWTLRGVDINDSSTQQGEHLFQRLLANGDTGKPKIRLRIALNSNQESSWYADARILANYGAADVVAVNQMNSKLWIADNQHFYIGSSGMDFRSFTQVKELGVLAKNCPHLTRDVVKIFKEYWHVGSGNKIPNFWPWTYDSHFNRKHPILLNVSNKYIMKAFVGTSPPSLTATGRNQELEAILNTIDLASSYIYIALRDYLPLLRLENSTKYWPDIDNSLRKAAVERKVTIKLLISWWKHSEPSEEHFLRSLQDLNQLDENVDIQIRRFVVPSNEGEDRIPYARFNYNSYMVTENQAYIGSSTWSGEYFIQSTGVGLFLMDNLDNINGSLRMDLLNVFQRDWSSSYALALKPHLQI